jgi:hypothetical protein
MIDGSKLLAVLRRFLPVLHLRVHGWNPLLARGRKFRGQGLTGHAPRSVEARASRSVTDSNVIDHRIGHRAVVNVKDPVAHIIHGTVIVEPIAAPITALIASSVIAVSIIDATVKTEM